LGDLIYNIESSCWGTRHDSSIWYCRYCWL